MSHVVDMKLDIKDLDALRKACDKLGLEFVEGQKTYKWYGVAMGEIPEGFMAKELGTCDHAIRVKNSGSKTYEVGVVKARNGRPGYQLLWDFWQGGYGLEDKVGKDGGLLKQRYSAEVARKQALREGYRVTETTDNQGRILLTVRR